MPISHILSRPQAQVSAGAVETPHGAVPQKESTETEAETGDRRGSVTRFVVHLSLIALPY